MICQEELEVQELLFSFIEEKKVREKWQFFHEKANGKSAFSRQIYITYNNQVKKIKHSSITRVKVAKCIKHCYVSEHILSNN